MPPAITIVVADVSFRPHLPGRDPEGPVGRNPTSDLSVDSIYKETHSSEEPTTHERHYAGWAADRDKTILRANELYDGSDSIEAALAIGNGPTEVEIVYRVDSEK
jgi:hypothetical protein